MKPKSAEATLIINSPLGKLLAKASETGICSFEFEDVRKPLSELPEILFDEKKNKHLLKLQKQVAEYFSGNRKYFDLALEPNGTIFQQKVWNELLKIPFGKTRTYKEQSIAVGDLKAIRAVATANGANPIAIIIPCHRIIGTDGSLTGYAGGLLRKKWLLEFEYDNSSKEKQLSLMEEFDK
ncbi:hypothetical protein LBMAG27_00050 [Bacteroidota bacterium]|nr:hypothetical protein LBMAG27_00050 [Bacteroidota bacterium]